MGKRFTKMLPKYIRDFNLDNRVARYIEQDVKPLPPRYPTTVKYHQEMLAHAPKLDEAKINEKVENMVKSIEINTTRYTPEIKTEKPLPQDRGPIEQFQYGYKEPRVLPAGKLTIRILDEIMSKYKESKTNERLEELSNKYNIDREKLKILIEYYRPFMAVKSKPKDKINENLEINNVFSNLKLLSENEKTLNSKK